MEEILQIETDRKNLENIVFKSLELAANRSNESEIIITRNLGFNVSTRYSKVEKIEFNKENLFEISIYKNKQKGVASSTDLSIDSITNTLKLALDIAYYTTSDSCAGIADKELLAFNAPDLNLFHISDISLEKAIELAIRTEQASLNIDKRITNTDGGHFNINYGIKIFGNSNGMLESYCFSLVSLSNISIAEENGNMERDYAYTIGRSIDDLKTPEWVGEESAKKALARLSPRKFFTRKSPVIFINEIASELFKHLVEAISGESVYRKSTFLLNSLGKKILPEWIIIKERPHLPKEIASVPFDNEGVLTKEQNIIENGILTTWLLNTYSARKLGFKSTGHASGIHNWYVTGQKLGLNEIIKEMRNGVLITELLGQGVCIVTGNYSRGASGFWIENGEIQYPISEITIAGNLKDMWNNIIIIGNDIDDRKNIKCGSILLSEMTISGK